MIPKVIHYCWFGKKPLNSLALKCIASWRKYLPDYEIKEWNEKNFDVKIVPYTQEAYHAKRYAFVSDYVRFYVLYHYGGIYFDTDVEVIKPINDILACGAFMGHEANIKDEIPLCVNPGLGMACEAGSLVLKDVLNYYSTLHFINVDGSHNLHTIVEFTTNILLKYGLKKQQGIQFVGDFRIYPKAYFNPYNAMTGKVEIREETRSIHHFAGSWITRREKFMKFVGKYFGSSAVQAIHKIKMMVEK